MNNLSQTLIISILIVIINYASSAFSGLGSVRAILVDSIIDLIFPICSIISLANPSLDFVLSVIQFVIIASIIGHLILHAITDSGSDEKISGASFVFITVSLALTIYCSFALSDICLQKPDNLSLKATKSHFDVDILSKVCVLILYILHKLNFSKPVIKYLDKIIMLLTINLILSSMAGSFDLYYLTLVKDIFTSFLIGGIPFAIVIPYVFLRINIGEFGSRSPGTTNVYRVVSSKYNKFIAIALTAAVGILDVYKAIYCYNIAHNPTLAFIAILGHMYSPFLSFKGGKGVAAFLGMAIALDKSKISVIVPILWSFLTLSKSSAEFYYVGYIRIKTSFAKSLVCMMVAIVINMMSFNLASFIYLLLGTLVVTWQHRDYITLIKKQ
jgi:acyl-phosphate glycerol 3-phosphate acyltransferase